MVRRSMYGAQEFQQGSQSQMTLHFRCLLGVLPQGIFLQHSPPLWFLQLTRMGRSNWQNQVKVIFLNSLMHTSWWHDHGPWTMDQVTKLFLDQTGVSKRWLLGSAGKDLLDDCPVECRHLGPILVDRQGGRMVRRIFLICSYLFVFSSPWVNICRGQPWGETCEKDLFLFISKEVSCCPAASNYKCVQVSQQLSC